MEININFKKNILNELYDSYNVYYGIILYDLNNHLNIEKFYKNLIDLDYPCIIINSYNIDNNICDKNLYHKYRLFIIENSIFKKFINNYKIINDITFILYYDIDSYNNYKFIENKYPFIKYLI